MEVHFLVIGGKNFLAVEIITFQKYKGKILQILRKFLTKQAENDINT